LPATPRTDAIILLAAAAILVVLIRTTWFHLVDDAYISFRYARNIVDGVGAVFNPGERVEGYSNPLWTGLLALGMKAGFTPAPLARWMGASATLLTLFMVSRWSRTLTDSRLTHASTVLAFALFLPVSVWASAGLETPLYTLWVVIAIWSLGRGVGGGSAIVLVGGAWALGLAAVTRPEGLGLFAVGLAWAIARARPVGSVGSVLTAFAGAAGCTWLPHIAWRRWYYGEWLPNTFAAKLGGAGSETDVIVRGAAYLTGFVQEAMGMAAIALVVIVVGTLVRGERHPRVGAGAVLTAAHLAGVVLVGGDGLTAYRFTHAALPGIAVAIGLGVAEAARRPMFRWPLTIALIAAVIGGLGAPHLRGDLIDDVRRETDEVVGWRTIGLWLRQRTEATDTIAVLAAGAMPYFSERATIDLLGLTDPIIARAPADVGTGQAGHERSNPEYVLAREPDIVVIGVYGLTPDAQRALPRPFYRAGRALLEHPEFLDSYRIRVGRTPRGSFPYYERVR
jgi:hypothetical protein